MIKDVSFCTVGVGRYFIKLMAQERRAGKGHLTKFWRQGTFAKLLIFHSWAWCQTLGAQDLPTLLPLFLESLHLTGHVATQRNSLLPRLRCSLMGSGEPVQANWMQTEQACLSTSWTKGVLGHL